MHQCRRRSESFLPFDVPAGAVEAAQVRFACLIRGPMYLTDPQLVLLSAASLRDDGAIEVPDDPRNGAARRAVDRLLSAGLIEEIPARGSRLVWRRDAFRGPIGLRITKDGLAAISADDATLLENCGSPRKTEQFQARTSEPSRGAKGGE
jgi:hypothetical protein